MIPSQSKTMCSRPIDRCSSKRRLLSPDILATSLTALVICVLSTGQSKATEGHGENTVNVFSSRSSARDLIYHHLTAAQALLPERRAELRRQLLISILQGSIEEPASLSEVEEIPMQGVKEDMDETALGKLLDLIAEAESKPHEYDAVQYRAIVLPPKKPTAMTLGEIFEWIDETPNQQHAIGRYQIIPATLSYLQESMGLGDETLFDSELQDKLALQLLEEAGLNDFLDGVMDREAFMDELAFVWAGLPLKSGLSAYHGINGNHATITREFYERQFASIFAEGVADTLKERAD